MEGFDPLQAYTVDTETGCWLWTRATDRRGYGHFKRGGRWHLAHRWIYEKLRGPIPPRLVSDHLCRRPGCVNPDHLEPVTNRENIMRGVGIGRPRTISRNTTRAENEEMTQMARLGATQRAVGLAFGVDRSVVARLSVRRET